MQTGLLNEINYFVVWNF